MMQKDAKIYIAGHQGMIGSAIHRQLMKMGYSNFVLRTSSELDLRDQVSVNHFFEIEMPEYVFLAADRSGGIHAHDLFRAEFIYDNLMMEANIIHQCYRTDVSKLIFIAPSTVYPKNSTLPMNEKLLLTGELEREFEFHAISKIAGIKMCEAYSQQFGCTFISAIVADVYGSNDTHSLEQAHVVTALIHKMADAKVHEKDSVEVWGTGINKREFLHADDLADACIFLMNQKACPRVINVGSGEIITIRELANMIKECIQYRGQLLYNPDKPDTRISRLLDTSLLKDFGWQPKISLRAGLLNVCQDDEHAAVYQSMHQHNRF